MRSLALIGLAALCSLAASAQAQPASSDPRIQVVEYQPDQVVLVRGAIGYQLMLEFSPDERIENVSIGDSLGWQVTPNRRANVLFLKPIDGTTTNMSVLTSTRRYLFDLTVAKRRDPTPSPFTIRFSYPQMIIPDAPPPVVEPERPPQVVNDAYALTGSRENFPVRVFDDGRATYFEWPADGALPAIFAVSADGAESVVNYSMRAPFVVVEQVAARFSLRNGAQVATVVNTRAAPVKGKPAK